MKRTFSVCILLLVFAGFSVAYNHFTGYSGAPTSNGMCTRSCHLQNDFTPTCEISGFPEVYTPGEQYTIVVKKTSGLSINQFNCSIRVDSDSSSAGELCADFNTQTYSSPNEAAGVHWETAEADSGTFTWTAPPTGAGYVTLYWSGLQGTRANGADTQIVLHASEIYNHIDYISDIPERIALEQNYPNPFNSTTTICFSVPEGGDAVLEISNILGHRVYGLFLPDASAGQYRIDWDGCDNSGNPLPSGLYFYQLRTSAGNLTRKLALLR
jgi:hypothetical protein